MRRRIIYLVSHIVTLYVCVRVNTESSYELVCARTGYEASQLETAASYVDVV